jgi:hypothetical protein
MNILWRLDMHNILSFSAGKLATLAALAATMSAPCFADQVRLTGANEVPPVETPATATGWIDVAADGAVTGHVTTVGIDGTMAHIHLAPAGKNGPAIISLVKDGGEWKVPAGAKLNGDQLNSYRSGNLYVNVHSDSHKSGEIRAQLSSTAATAATAGY